MVIVNANIAALLTAVLTALTWAITIDLILIRRFKNRGSILKYNFWTAFLMGTNLLICLPTLAFFNHQSLSWLVRQAWLLAVVTDILTTGALIIFILVTWIMRLIPVPSCFDFLIVLGAALNKGKVPPVLAARLDRAVELWKTNPEAVIIVTGGVAHGDQVAEAVAMGQHLQRLGVPAGKILQEKEAMNTWQNLENCLMLVKQRWQGPGTPKIVVVTSSFHILRAASYGRRLGLHWNWVSAPTPWPYLPLTLVRDFLGNIRDHRKMAILIWAVALILGETI